MTRRTSSASDTTRRAANPLAALTPLTALALLALLHTALRYIIDPRSIDGILRPLIALWFTGLGATYALTWVGHDLGRKLLPVWGIASVIGYLLDALGVMSSNAPSDLVQALNWMGVGLGIVLALMGYTFRNAPPH